MKTRILLSAASVLTLLAAPATAGSMSHSDMTGGAMMNTGEKAQFSPAKPNQFKAESLIGKEVQNMQGENLGDVKTVVLNKQGEAKGVILGVGGYLGMGERDVAVRWDDLRFNQSGSHIQLNATRQALENATAYNLPEEQRGKASEMNVPADHWFAEGAQPGRIGPGGKVHPKYPE